MKPNPRSAYLLLALAAIVAGLSSRQFSECLPAWLAEYGGDTMWALTVYWFVGLLFATPPIQFSILLRTCLALGFAFSIEFSQLYQAPWINSLRETRLGGLVLGFGFLWTDLVCYSVGTLFGAAGEWIIAKKRCRVQPGE